MLQPALEITGISHRYGDRQALQGLSLTVKAGEVFAFLGPNGSGKTTLFRLLSTLIPLQAGQARVLGYDIARDTLEVRRRMGVVFQAPSIDRQLTVAENLRHQGHLYGLAGRPLEERIDGLLTQLGIADRRRDRVEVLSGGLRRRVELAKCLLHDPKLLLLDEPSTGLDPGARADLWAYLQRLRREQGVTIVLTTHLLDEAERADRIAILHRGELITVDTPTALRATVGGDSITIRTSSPERLAAEVTSRFGCQVSLLDGTVRLEQPEGHTWVARLVDAFPEEIESITLGKPTLEDVFLDRTGHLFHEAGERR